MANVMVVDDSKDMLEVLKFILHEAGHKVICVSGRLQMMHELKTFLPDIIILDVRLGEDDGREVCKALKTDEHTIHISILLMSASPKLLANHSACGADDIIAKPFHLDELTEKVGVILKLFPLI